MITAAAIPRTRFDFKNPGTTSLRGNTAATVAGAVGGAVVGNEISKEHAASHDYYKVAVRMRDGREETYTRDSVGDLHVGDRVRVTDSGRIERD